MSKFLEKTLISQKLLSLDIDIVKYTEYFIDNNKIDVTEKLKILF